MEWWLSLTIILGILLVLMTAGVPIFVAFTATDIIAIYFWWGGTNGLIQFAHSIYSSIATFVLLPVLLFILMGELLFHSGVFVKALDTLDKWMGRIPGRLCLLSLGGATLFSTLSGSALGTSAMLGSLLLPEMEKRGYNRTLALGSCMSGALAMIIPPSSMAVILASLADISVGKLLMSGVLPGLVMAALYGTYIVLRCVLQPSIAPAYTLQRFTWAEKISGLIKNVLPFGIIILAVTGMMLAGLATPTESAALGVLTTAGIVAGYREMNYEIVRKSVSATLRIVVMMFMIFTGSNAFAQVLAFTGASNGLIDFVVNLNWPPLLIIVMMQFMLIVIGTFMEEVSTMMITLPIFMPIVKALHFDGVWFGLLTLINMEIGMKSPPFAMLLFVMQGVAPKGTTHMDVFRAVIPFLLLDCLVMVVIFCVPSIATYIPNLIKH
jgi:tripartite ATP-independent transporter DctM subunit